MGLVDGGALDRSGLDGQTMCRVGSSTDCIDQATFGGFGSGMTYTGHDNVFLAVPDRGPFGTADADLRVRGEWRDARDHLSAADRTGAALPAGARQESAALTHSVRVRSGHLIGGALGRRLRSIANSFRSSLAR